MSGRVIGLKRRYRFGIGRLMLTTLLAASLCSLATGHDPIAWQSKRFRMISLLDRLETLAQPLRQAWPTTSGEMHQTGPFMAYPVRHPRTLVLLTPVKFDSPSVTINTIERGRHGSLRLRLAGADEGDWIEWHPHKRHPTSFTGGLGDSHSLQRFLPMTRGWYLVRYDS
ncbi:hypothetical protein Pan14r_41500 [Crateriforma conspicua]|uniref:Uncharacterized protein n=2 Tax=Crateriforma conspicua TaxID=2527996 RepID=A0A5C5YAH2_9PLAN|nr:hypothetical protein Pan14r_41500 [Crateriforma conspicua]